MSEPILGIVVPTFQRRLDVAGTVRSLLHQDVRARVHLVVVDDGSTDGTLEHLVATFPEEVRRVEDRISGVHRPLAPEGRLVVIRQPNQHVSAARNAGLKELLALGCTHLGHQDAGDLALPHKLRALLGFLHRRPDLGLVHAWSRDLSMEGFLLPEGQGTHEVHFRRPRPGGSLWERAERGELRPGDLREVNYVHNHTPLYTRAALLAAGEEGWFPVGVRYGEDWAFYQRLEAAGVRFGFVARVVALSRSEPDGLSTTRAEAASTGEILALARAAPPRERADLLVRARRRDPAGFGEALRSAGLWSAWAEAVASAEGTVAALRSQGRLPEALTEAHRLRALEPSEGASEQVRELACALAAALAPERERAARAGDLPAALEAARQVFALDPSQEHASALAWLTSLVEG